MGKLEEESQKNNSLIELSVKKIMTKNPISVDKDMLAVKGLAIMSEKKITSLCVHKKNSPKKQLAFFIYIIYWMEIYLNE